MKDEEYGQGWQYNGRELNLPCGTGKASSHLCINKVSASASSLHTV